MLTVWGRKSSSNVQAVMWCIAELELECRRLDAGFTYGVVDTPEYLATNPNGTVPTLQDGDQPPLFESGAIIRYLANTYGSDPFWPSDAARRAQVDQWTEWSKINTALGFTGPIFWKVVRTAPSQQNPDAILSGINALTRYLQIAEKRLATHAYLAGGELTLADIQFGHTLFRYFDIEIERPELPALRDYYDRLCSRSSYREHVMVDYEELRVLD